MSSLKLFVIRNLPPDRAYRTLWDVLRGRITNTQTNLSGRRYHTRLNRQCSRYSPRLAHKSLHQERFDVLADCRGITGAERSNRRASDTDCLIEFSCSVVSITGRSLSISSRKSSGFALSLRQRKYALIQLSIGYFLAGCFCSLDLFVEVLVDLALKGVIMIVPIGGQSFGYVL